jgi:phosphoribulokinase
MSRNHPIVAVTGASGAGTTVVKQAFEHIFRRESVSAAFVAGENFRRYDRTEMQDFLAEKQAEGVAVSPYGPEVNRFDLLESMFDSYGQTGTATMRRYLSQECSDECGLEGQFSDWEPLPDNSDLLFYEGLHGGVVSNHWTRRKMSASHNPKVITERRAAGQNSGVDVAQHVDLLLGVVPVVNLEWIQKINQDRDLRGFSSEATSRHIVERMQDYIHFIVPQFSVTDINFQRVPIVDTSNPFVATAIPDSHECIVVIRFREPARFNFPQLQQLIDGAYMSRPNCMVISGSVLEQAIDVISTPLIHELLVNR